MALSRARVISKVGKKLCYPDIPSNWVRATVELIQSQQNYLPKCHILYPIDHGYYDYGKYNYSVRLRARATAKVKFEEYEHDEKYCYYRRRCKYNQEYSKKYGAFSYFHLVDLERLKDTFWKPCDDYKSEHVDDYNWKEEDTDFDVVSMLSKMTSNGLMRCNGDKVVDIETALRGKNVLVSCLYVPVLWWDDVPLRALVSHYNACKGGDDEYELVIAAQMVPNYDNDEDAFNHFLSGFPISCLAVPFEDAIGRDSVCANLSLRLCPVALFVDSNQKVVYHNSTPDDKYGFGFYPFSNLFGCDQYPCWSSLTHLDSFVDSDFVYKVKSDNVDDMSGDKVSVSELKEKLVGLYLCYDGTFIRTLDLISRECQARNQDFQIVMIYFPYKRNVNPRFFMEAINHVLQNLNILSTNSNWWVSPFNDSLSRRIWEFYDYFHEDKLIILEPGKTCADPFGKPIFDLYGINGYPFTREVVVNKETEALRATTLESCLVYGSRDYVLRMNYNNDICNVNKVPIAELRGKIILLYVAATNIRRSMYYDFLDWYDWNKTTRLSDFDVVFVCVDEQFQSSLRTPWLVCPYDPQYATFVQNKILKGRHDILAVFGKDGRIITLDALDLLNSYGPKGFPSFEWYSGLRNEVIGDLSDLQEIEYIAKLAD